MFGPQLLRLAFNMAPFEVEVLDIPERQQYP